MIYFDNAATTNYKPPEVINTVVDCLTNYSFNANRSGHKKAIELSQKIMSTREKIANFVNLPLNGNVIFSGSCTQSLNLALIGSAKRHGHVITTMCEHNSVLRPLHEMQKNGIITLTVLKPDENGDITSEMVKDALRPNTYLVAMNAVSNVTGHAQKITNIGELLSQYNVKFLVDGAQSVGYLPINMARDHINMLSIPSHKGLHGMQGAGALCVNNIELLPIVYGGTGTESEKVYQPTTLPDGYEAGTLPTPAILSMGAGIEWINVAKINELPTILRLCELIISGLRQIPTVTVYSEINQSGIIAFNIGDLDSSLISDSLSSGYDIATRSGLHCAPLMHQALGTTKTGIVRVSVSGSNTANECYTLLNAVNQLKNKLTK